MNKRKLLDHTEIEETEFAVTLTVLTKCPQKWKLIDLETGEEYIGQSHSKKHWKKIKNGH